MVFRKIGSFTWQHIASWALFFRFTGHLCVSIIHAFTRKIHIPWSHTLDVLYNSGAKLTLPLILVSILTGLGMTLNIHYLLTPYGLQNKALIIAITAIYRDVVPLLIGIVLCIQSALNLIEIEGRKLQNLPQKDVFEYLFPIVAGINLTAMLLYIYMISTSLVSMFLAFHYILHYENFLMRISSLIHVSDVLKSIFKTAIYCTMLSPTVGYYYYEVAVKDILVRKAVSRIITRGLFWILLATTYLKLFSI